MFRVVRLFEDEELAMGPDAHCSASDRILRSRLGSMQQQIVCLPDQIGALVAPQLNNTIERRLETTERQLETVEQLSRRHTETVDAIQTRGCAELAAECLSLGQRYWNLLRPRHDDGNGFEYSDFDMFRGEYRQPVDSPLPWHDDLDVIEQHIQDECGVLYDGDAIAANFQTAWVRRLRVLVEQGYDSGVPELNHCVKRTQAYKAQRKANRLSVTLAPQQ